MPTGCSEIQINNPLIQNDYMNKEISANFWDFIEKYIPEHSSRKDVLRQAELQEYIDDHESSIQDMTKTEAWNEQNKILNALYFEAINNQIQGLGSNCEKCRKFMGKCSYCPNCGKKLISRMGKEELRIKEDVGDTILVKLSTGKFPETYKKKYKDFIESDGFTKRDATISTNDTIFQLELFYSKGQGLFAVEADAAEYIPIFNPYDGKEIPNDNL